MLACANDSGRRPRSACGRAGPDDGRGAAGTAVQTRFHRSRTKHNLDFHCQRHRAARTTIPLSLQSLGIFELRLAGEIAAYLSRVGHAEGGSGNAPDFERLAKDSRNNVRDCLMRLEVELMAL